VVASYVAITFYRRHINPDSLIVCIVVDSPYNRPLNKSLYVHHTVGLHILFIIEGTYCLSKIYNNCIFNYKERMTKENVNDQEISGENGKPEDT
jgi:hypothetical protein